jgi:hypothetical protein
MPESTFMGMGLNSGPDLKHFLNATKSLRSALFVASRILAHGRDVMVHGRGVRLVNGNALAARLLKTALDRAIPLWPSSPAVQLLKENGRVAGAIVEKDGKAVRVDARHGIVFAAGGFPHDADRTRRHFKHLHADTEHAIADIRRQHGRPPRMAEDVNAALDDSFSNAAAWVRCRSSHERTARGRFFHLIDRAKPGVIAVTRRRPPLHQ